MLLFRRPTGTAEPRTDAAVVARARRRGRIASVVAMPLAVAPALYAFVTLAFPGTGLVLLPAGIVTLVLLIPLVVAGQAVVAECRRPATARQWALPEGARGMCVFAAGIGLLSGPFSYLFLLLAVTRGPCFPYAEDDPPESCDHATAFEIVGIAAWIGVMGVVLLLLIACVVAARRSRTVFSAAVPLVMSGCVIAVDVANLAANLAGGH